MSPGSKFGHRWVWWVYLGMVLAIGVGRMAERLLRDAGGFWSQFGPLLLCLAIFFGTWAWLVQRPLLHPWLWRLVHGLVCIAALAALAYAFSLVIGEELRPASMLLGLALMLLPACWCLFRYAYQNAELWRNA